MGTLLMRDAVLRKAGALRAIPTSRNAAKKVFSVLDDPGLSCAEFHNVLKYDPAVSAKIIGIANCPYYNRGIEIYTLHKAMATIGLNEVKRIVMCALHLNALLEGPEAKTEDLIDLWKHSVLVACASRTIASRTFTDDPEKAFTVGLLHDIGKMVFYATIEDYGKVMERTTLNGKDVSAVEETLFGITHGELGWYVAKKWGLPEEFSTVIRRHHESNYDDDHRDVLGAVKTADRFFLSPEAPSDAQGLILFKERNEIEDEAEKMAVFIAREAS